MKFEFSVGFPHSVILSGTKWSEAIKIHKAGEAFGYKSLLWGLTDTSLSV